MPAYPETEISFAPPGLVTGCDAIPRLAPWAAFFRRFAAGGCNIDSISISGSAEVMFFFCIGDAALDAPLFHGVAGDCGRGGGIFVVSSSADSSLGRNDKT